MPIESYTVTGLFEGYTFSELKERTLQKLRQKSENYDRYSEAKVENALNDALIKAVGMTGCLRAFAIIRMKDGFSQYKPPTQMLKPTKAFFYQSATSYYELPQKTRAWLDKHKRGWRAMDGDPLYMYPGDSYGNLRKLGFAPTPDTDGNDYASSPDSGIYASESSMETSGNVEGVNNAAHATICTDSDGRTLSDEGVQVGMMAVNVTDDSSGQITAVSGSTFTVTLAGGTNNTWAVGDSFMILAGEYGVVVDWTNEEHFLFTADIGGIADVETLVGNVYLEFTRRPLKMHLNNHKPELPPELHIYLPDGAVWFLKRDAPQGSNDYQMAVTAWQAFEKGIKGDYIDLESVMEDSCLTDYH